MTDCPQVATIIAPMPSPSLPPAGSPPTPALRPGWFPNSRVPRTKLGRLTALLALLRVLLFAGQAAFSAGATTSGLQSLGNLVTTLLVILLLLLGLRHARGGLIWRLRNRLLVTYIFIGVVPVLLVVLMAGIAAYLLTGQFAIFLATDDIKAAVNILEAATSTAAAEMANDLQQGNGPSEDFSKDAGEFGLGGRFAAAAVTAVDGGQKYLLHGAKPLEVPPWVHGNFSGVVVERGSSLSLRVVTSMPVGAGKITVLSSALLDAAQLTEISRNLGEITVYPGAEVHIESSGKLSAQNRDGGGPVILRPARGEDGKPSGISGGSLAAPVQLLDREVSFPTVIPVTDWETGKERNVVIVVKTRVSSLYARLFTNFTKFAEIIKVLLVVVAVLFAGIEAVALIVGFKLTRTITGSVENLYVATESINRGDLGHRIAVKSKDQLAALETSFNSMSGSLERLLEEQKEKERLESELAIAHEVQATLFPRDIQPMRSLELHGVCKPARTVSGDYYDFLSFGNERLGIAVGDISGKGISAALLMANIHSAVRVYEFGQTPAAQDMTVANRVPSIRTAAGAGDTPEILSNKGMASPSEVLWLLNRHLYHSTSEEKYMTLFLGVYDGNSRNLTYSNAGHLPPILIAVDGSIRRLDAGGLVIGLFDNVSHEEQTVQLGRGEILLAFSDGVTEPENEFGEFGEERLIKLVRENRHLSLARIAEIVTTTVDEWIGGAERPDDVTVVLARVV